MADSRLKKYCERIAKQDISFAKQKIKDKTWLRKASEMSKEMVFKNAQKSYQDLGKSHCNYLLLRACGKTKVRGLDVWIDESARNRYKKIVGRFPNCNR